LKNYILKLLKLITQFEKQQEKMKKAMQQSPPKNEKSYLFDLIECPEYKGYIPQMLGYEVCKYCGCHNYYH